MEGRLWKVLLADDVEIFLELEKTFLQRDNVELIAAPDGDEALAAVQRERPDLVVLGLSLPGMKMTEVCRRVKEDPVLRATPVLMVVSEDRDEERALCERAGCDGILTRPIERGDLLAAVRERVNVVERRAPRVPARLRISFGGGGGEALTDFTVNVSSGGVFVETARRFAVGDPLRTSFVLPDRAEPLRCRSQVAWVNEAERPLTPSLPAGIGLQFLDLSTEDRAAIISFVKERLVSPLW